MKICFLGAAAVGKTTFVSALLTMAEAYPRFYAPFQYPDGRENSAVKDIQKDADILSIGGHVPSTTMVRNVFGRLLLGENFGVDVEFIDLPGSLFTSGYIQKDLEAIRQIRDFVLDADYLYFFFEPADFEGSSGERVRTFMEVLQDYFDAASPAKVPHVSLVLAKADLCPEVYMGAGDHTNPEDVRNYMVSRSNGAVEKLIEMAHGDSQVSYAAISTRSETSPLVLSPADFQGLFQGVFDYVLKKEKENRTARILKPVLWTSVALGLGCAGVIWYTSQQEALITVIETPKQTDNRKNREYEEWNSKLESKKSDVITKENYSDLKIFFKEEMKKAPVVPGKENLYSKADDIWNDLETSYKNRLESRIRAKRDTLVGDWSEPVFCEFTELRDEYIKYFSSLPKNYDLPENIRDYHRIKHIANITARTPVDKVRTRIEEIKDYLLCQRVISSMDVAGIRRALTLGEYLCGPANELTIEVAAACPRIHKDEKYWFIIDEKVQYDKVADESVVENVSSLVKASEDGGVVQRVSLSWHFGQAISIRFWESGNWRSAYDEHLRGVRSFAYNQISLSSLCDSASHFVEAGDWKDDGLRFTTRVFKGAAAYRNSGADEITYSDIQNVNKYLLEDAYWEEKMEEVKPQ